MAGNGTQSLERGLAILNLLRFCYPEGLWVTEIAQRLQLHRTTVQRMIVPLENNGWMQKKSDGKRYFALENSPKPVIKTPVSLPGGTDEIPESIIIVMRGLAKQSGDAVFLVAKDGCDSVGIHREIGQYPVQIMGTYPGKRNPLGVGAPGMALLAATEERAAREAIQANKERLKDFPGISEELMWTLRTNALDRGYVVMKNFAVFRTIGVAKWFRIRDFETVFAMGVGGVSERMTVEKQGKIIAFMREELEKLAVVDLMSA